MRSFLGPVWIGLLSAYAKHLMQINKLLSIIHMLVKVVYEKIAYEDTNFNSEYLRINIKKLGCLHKLKNKLIQTGQ